MIGLLLTLLVVPCGVRSGQHPASYVYVARDHERMLDPAFLEHPGIAGAARKYEGAEGRFDGWVARRWDPAVRERFARLLAALAAGLDGVIEGVNL